MKDLMNWLASEESGQGMVEYGLILALVSIVVVGMLNGLGDKLGAIFTDVAGKLKTSGGN